MLHLGFDLLGGGLVDFDPWFFAGLEDFRKSESTFGGVGAEFGLPDYRDFVVGVCMSFFWHRLFYDNSWLGIMGAYWPPLSCFSPG